MSETKNSLEGSTISGTMEVSRYRCHETDATNRQYQITFLIFGSRTAKPKWTLANTDTGTTTGTSSTRTVTIQ